MSKLKRICKNCNWHRSLTCPYEHDKWSAACGEFFPKTRLCTNCKYLTVCIGPTSFNPDYNFCQFWERAPNPIELQREFEEDAVGSRRKDSDTYDPFALVDEIVRNDFDPSLFSVIDDRDMPLAPNVVEFITGKDYLNLTPYPKQIEIPLEACNDYCPDCSDPRIIGNMFDQPLQEIYSRVQLLNHGVCPKCKKSRLDFFAEGKMHHHNEIIGIAGQRSGKSVEVGGMFAPYILHWFLKIPNPSYYFGLLPNSMLHFTFVALTYKQAEDTLWEPFTAAIDESVWFKNYHEMLNHYGKKYGQPFLNYRTSFLLYNHKRCFVSPAGPDKRVLRGRTRVFSAVDEICWFDFQNKNLKKINADEVDIALRRSLRTIRSASLRKRRKDPHVPDAWNVNISSPSSARDKGMQLLKQAEKTTTMYSFHKATWEMNPTITREDLNTEFENDPIGAKRDYGAEPPLAADPFISNPLLLKKVVNVNAQNMLRCTRRKFRDKSGVVTVYSTLNYAYKEMGYPMILSADAGASNNAFALVVQHRDFQRNKFVVDGIVEIRPDKEVGARVNFPKVIDEVMVKLVKDLPIKMFVSDTWQNIAFQQTLSDQGIASIAYSMKSSDFDTLYGYITGQEIEFPRPESAYKTLVNPNTDYEQFVVNRPVAHALLQLITVQKIGKKLTKGEGYDDDIFRAWALGVKFLADEKYEELFRSLGGSSRKEIGSSFAVAGGRGSKQIIKLEDTTAQSGASPYIEVHKGGVAIGGMSKGLGTGTSSIGF